MRAILVKMDGVKEVTTNRESLTATVTFDPAKTSAKKLADGLGAADSHYAATVKEGS